MSLHDQLVTSRGASWPKAEGHSEGSRAKKSQRGETARVCPPGGPSPDPWPRLPLWLRLVGEGYLFLATESTSAARVTKVRCSHFAEKQGESTGDRTGEEKVWKGKHLRVTSKGRNGCRMVTLPPR